MWKLSNAARNTKHSIEGSIEFVEGSPEQGFQQKCAHAAAIWLVSLYAKMLKPEYGFYKKSHLCAGSTLNELFTSSEEETE